MVWSARLSSRICNFTRMIDEVRDIRPRHCLTDLIVILPVHHGSQLHREDVLVARTAGEHLFNTIESCTEDGCTRVKTMYDQLCMIHVQDTKRRVRRTEPTSVGSRRRRPLLIY